MGSCRRQKMTAEKMEGIHSLNGSMRISVSVHPEQASKPVSYTG
jgi:hypothetical protein